MEVGAGGANDVVRGVGGKGIRVRAVPHGVRHALHNSMGIVSLCVNSTASLFKSIGTVSLCRLMDTVRMQFSVSIFVPYLDRNCIRTV